MPARDHRELRLKYLGPSITNFYETIMMHLATLVTVSKPFHTVQVDPKLTYHGHIKHLHLTVRQNNDEGKYPFEDAYEELNPDKMDGDNSSSVRSFWTDIFLYWLDDKHVRDGSWLAFFSDVNPGKTIFSVCYRQFIVTKDIYEGILDMPDYEPLINPKWWN